MEVTEVEEKVDKQLGIRDIIQGIEAALREFPNAIIGDSEQMPLKHSFTDGIYVREIFIPAGMIVVGKLHKHQHPNFLMEGEVVVITEGGGREHLKAPLAMISDAGTKRALVTLKPTKWITVHHNPNNTRDFNELEDLIIAKSYDELEEHLHNQIKGELT